MSVSTYLYCVNILYLAQAKAEAFTTDYFSLAPQHFHTSCLKTLTPLI